METKHTARSSWGEFTVKVEGVIHSADDWFKRWGIFPPVQSIPRNLREKRMLLYFLHTRRPNAWKSPPTNGLKKKSK